MFMLHSSLAADFDESSEPKEGSDCMSSIQGECSVFKLRICTITIPVVAIYENTHVHDVFCNLS